MNNELWPPLSVIRNAFETGAATPTPDGANGGATTTVATPGPTPGTGTEAAPSPPLSDLLLPLTELARRREAVAQRAFTARWAPGRLVSVLHDGRLARRAARPLHPGRALAGLDGRGRGRLGRCLRRAAGARRRALRADVRRGPGLERARPRAQPRSCARACSARCRPRGSPRCARCTTNGPRTRRCPSRPSRGASPCRAVGGACSRCCRARRSARRTRAPTTRRSTATRGCNWVRRWRRSRGARQTAPRRPARAQAAAPARGRLVGQHPPLVRRRRLGAPGLRGAGPVRAGAEHRPASAGPMRRTTTRCAYRAAPAAPAHGARQGRPGRCAGRTACAWTRPTGCCSPSRPRWWAGPAAAAPGGCACRSRSEALAVLAASPLVEAAGPVSERQ
jgi:hypothetical protein